MVVIKQINYCNKLFGIVINFKKYFNFSTNRSWSISGDEVGELGEISAQKKFPRKAVPTRKAWGKNSTFWLRKHLETNIAHLGVTI